MFPSAPIAWQGKVFIGIAFSDAGIAGRLLALDAATGKELWRFNTTLGFGAGGGFWASYSLDPTTGEVFGGVGNPYPDWSRDFAPNDIAGTAMTNSVISVIRPPAGSTGTIRPSGTTNTIGISPARQRSTAQPRAGTFSRLRARTGASTA